MGVNISTMHAGVWLLYVLSLMYAGLVLTILIIEFLGRKKTMAVEFIACMVAFLLLYICAVP